MISAAVWVLAVVAVEGGARRAIASRARAWIASYVLLGASVVIAGAHLRREGDAFAPVWLGVALALVGYPVGRALLADRPQSAPEDRLWWELPAVGVMVPVVEELIWGGRVEAAYGVAATSALFAAKHVVIDRRWRRFLGLAVFWAGLGVVRAVHPLPALLLHVAANSGGVVLGHATRKDQF